MSFLYILVVKKIFLHHAKKQNFLPKNSFFRNSDEGGDGGKIFLTLKFFRGTQQCFMKIFKIQGQGIFAILIQAYPLNCRSTKMKEENKKNLVQLTTSFHRAVKRKFFLSLELLPWIELLDVFNSFSISSSLPIFGNISRRIRYLYFNVFKEEVFLLIFYISNFSAFYSEKKRKNITPPV